MTSPRWGELTAVFGGTFDPPHSGHRQALLDVMITARISRALVIPAGLPPQKPAQGTPLQRLEMARICFEGISGVEVSPLEIERQVRTGLPSYTFDTLQELRDRKPAFVLGTDQLQKLSSWHRFPDLLQLGHWIVLARRPGGLEEAHLGLAEWVSQGVLKPGPSGDLGPTWYSGRGWFACIETDAPALSSTQIREAFALNGNAPQGSLSPGVEAYLKRNLLYGSRGGE